MCEIKSVGWVMLPMRDLGLVVYLPGRLFATVAFWIRAMSHKRHPLPFTMTPGSPRVYCMRQTSPGS
jgi:hypothetical protein